MGLGVADPHFEGTKSVANQSIGPRNDSSHFFLCLSAQHEAPFFPNFKIDDITMIWSIMHA